MRMRGFQRQRRRGVGHRDRAGQVPGDRRALGAARLDMGIVDRGRQRHLAGDRQIGERAPAQLVDPNALLPEGLAVLQAWGFTYKSNIVWHKIRKDGGSDGRGVGFYFRNVTELLLFGVRGKNARTLAPGRRQVNMIETRKREHSRKPDEQYKLIEDCSPGPYLEMFGRGIRRDWAVWGDQADETYTPTWKTYAHHSQARRRVASFG